jgi:hypothetical protein
MKPSHGDFAGQLFKLMEQADAALGPDMPDEVAPPEVVFARGFAELIEPTCPASPVS